VAEAQDAKRIKKLEQERDDLRKKLEAATKELSARQAKMTPARALETEKQLAAMRAKLDVLEANPVPYTPEEAALFHVPKSKPVETVSKSARNASKDLPPGSSALYAEAKRYYSAKEYDKAEDRYLQVLRQEEGHVPTLANLAAVELELNHLPQAETNIVRAIAIAPDDPACLAILGNLRYRQAKYDAALDALSATKADPKNAEAQNYLGLTLSAKGLRGPAETALRKAIQLEPRYGDAHINLAVIYATQKPPLLALARWHYQRALDAGAKPNPDLEKVLEGHSGAEAAK
jgi:tetratricopeptide (TPR) repeat protein